MQIGTLFWIFSIFYGMYEATNSVISETDSNLHISYIHFFSIAFDILSFLAEGAVYSIC